MTFFLFGLLMEMMEKTPSESSALLRPPTLVRSKTVLGSETIYGGHGEDSAETASREQVFKAAYVLALIVVCGVSLFLMGPRLVFPGFFVSLFGAQQANSVVFLLLYAAGARRLDRRLVRGQKKWKKTLKNPWNVICHVLLATIIPMITDCLALKFEKLKWFGLLRMFHLLSFRPVFGMLDTNLSVPQQVTPLLRTILIMVLFTHLAACLFWFLAEMKDFDAETTWVGSQAAYLIDAPPSTQYIYSLYLASVTLSTVGFGDLAPVSLLETTWMVIYIFGSILILANIVGVISALAAMKDTEMAESRARIARFERMLQVDHISQDVATATRAYLRLALRASTVDVDSLPASVKLRIRDQRFGKFLRDLPLFEGCSDRFLRQCLASVREDSFVKGHDVVRSGDLETRLCILLEGHATISLDNDDEIGILHPGSCFGAEGFVSSLPQPWTVCGRSVLRVVSLDDGDRDRLEKANPHDWALLRTNLFAMTKDLRRTASLLSVDDSRSSREKKKPQGEVKLKKQKMSFDRKQLGLEEAFRSLASKAADIEEAILKDAAMASRRLGALHCDVAAAGDARELKRLLDIVPVNAVPGDYDGRTAMHLAAASGHADCLRLLLDAGADKDAVDRFGRTPLAEAVLNGKDDVIRLLKCHHARLHLPRTAETLCYAASVGDAHLIRRYCDAGADLDATDYDKRTCLMLAAAQGNLPLCDLLISRGATKTKKDRWNHSAYDEAISHGHTGPIADLLSPL